MTTYQGGGPGAGRRWPGQAGRSMVPPTRLVAAVALVAVSTLGGAYAFGRGLGDGPDPDGQARTAVTAAATSSAPTRRAHPQARRPQLPQLPAEPDGGPFGSRVTTGSLQVALTFDDGPDPVHTPRTLAVLRQHRVKATFCLVGANARAHPDLVRAIAADGHTLCNHSWWHDLELGRRSPDQIRADMVATNQAIESAAPGTRVRYFRHPGGNWTGAAVAMAAELGMTSLHWDVDPRDWALPGVGTVVSRVVGGTTAGSIVLLHDGGGDRRSTVEALRVILPTLGRRFTLAALPDGPAVNPPPARAAAARPE